MSEKNSNEEKVLTKEEKALQKRAARIAKKEAKAEKKRNRKPMSGREIGIMIIIIIICIALGGTGLFTLVYTSISQNQNKNLFGTYNGEEINLESGSTLAQQYSNLSQQNSDALSSGDTSATLSVWSQAYQNAVAITAMNQMANEAGLETPQYLVDKEILKTGYYNDKDGKFDQSIYDGTDNSTKKSIETSVKSNLPIEIITNDIETITAPEAEKDFVVEMANKTRSFEYAIIDFNQIPDDVAAEFGATNPALYKTIDLSVLTVANENDCKDIYTSLMDGTLQWSDAVTNNSLDSFKDSDGKIGVLAAWNISQNLKEESDLDVLFTTDADSYTQPIAGVNGGWSIYKINATPIEPDFSTSETLIQVKAYMSNNNPDVLKQYVGDQAEEIAQELSVDFDATVEKYGLTTINVEKTSNNYGNSSYMGGLSYTDKVGLLSTAATDKEVTKAMYTEDIGFISNAIAVDSSYIVYKITDIEEDPSQGSMVSMFYDYYLQQQDAQDFYSAIYNSSKHDNKFFEAFMKIILPQLQSTEDTTITE
ncbi:MAG: SurA N-terminal domain-containing protein [Sphaerochaetaceae bacterium]|nr:SurA N-terminal domain-containing protein [Sphaerochaetaceae bacterium]